MMHEAADRGLAHQFRHLGMIPLPEVYALLRASTALINPSALRGLEHHRRGGQVVWRASDTFKH